MALKHFHKGYILSSTPLQSPGDSGYFGSSRKRNKSNASLLTSCSPIKESTYKNLPEDFPHKHDLSPQVKCEKNLHFVNLTKTESVSNIEVNELSKLEFTSPNFNSLTSPFLSQDQLSLDGRYETYRATRDVSDSLLGDNDIRYNLFDWESSGTRSSNEPFALRNYQNCDSKSVSIFKQKKVDFMHELFEKNCFSIISYILSFLSAKELCITSCVSKEWNKIIVCDSKANIRRQNLIAERLAFLNGPLKENRKGIKYGPAKEHKSAFSNLTNINTSLQPSVDIKVSNTKFDSFMKEAKSSKSKLFKCPRCFHASKWLNKDNYLCTCCSYNFCSNCLNPILSNHTCFKPQLPNIVIGSKKSKKNLRRL